MRALLLAAGLGTRLRPLTDVLPKCLAPIRGRPLLDFWLELLLENGIAQVLVNTHYLANLVTEFVGASPWAERVTFVHEPKLLGTAGTVLQNRDFFGNEPFLVAHADNLTLFNVHDFAARHAARPAQAEMTLMTFETADPRSCGIVELDTRGIVQAFHEKAPMPPGNLANAAVYLLEPAMIDFLAGLGKPEIDFSTEVIPRFLGRIFTYRNTDYHRDIGTIASWNEAQSDFPEFAAGWRARTAWERLLGLHSHRIRHALDRLIPGILVHVRKE